MTDQERESLDLFLLQEGWNPRAVKRGSTLEKIFHKKMTEGGCKLGPDPEMAAEREE